MTWVLGFGRFWYRFIVGDDWTIAASICLGLLVVFVLRLVGLSAWWLMPLVVVAVLAFSLWRARERA